MSVPDELHPRPTGWYAVGFSSDLKRGRVQSRLLFGQRFAVFRTSSGVPAVLHSVCPHLGADLSRGRVCGEQLRCPFHQFDFDAGGRCVATPYPGRTPPKARVRSLPVVERDGMVLAWWDEHGRAPSWEPTPPDMRGWTPLRHRMFEFTAHPLSTSENSVDVGHFVTVHGFKDLEIVEPIREHGHYMTGSYSFGHKVGPIYVRNSFTVHLWGLGYSLVENRVDRLGLDMRMWILATPTHNGRLELRLATSTPIGQRPLLGKPLARLVQEISLFTLSQDVAQDFDIWTHRTHVERPALAPGDGPIGLYRRWARQFDPRRSADDGAPELRSVGTG